MKMRPVIAFAVGLCMVIAFGGLYASNMGFKVRRLLEEQTSGVSATGQTQIGLPYNPEIGISTVSDLYDDINHMAGTFPCAPFSCAVVSISRFVRSSDAFQPYSGAPLDDVLNDFPIDGVEGLRIQVRQRVNYVIVGSHDPGRVVHLDSQGTNGSATGQTEMSFPYHGTAANASDLWDEINAASASGNAVVEISRYIKADDSFQTYAGRPEDVHDNFPTAPGRSYRIRVREDVAFVPSHY